MTVAKIEGKNGKGAEEKMAKALINQNQGKCKRFLYVLSVQSTKAFDTLVSQPEGKYAALKLYCLTNIKIHD